MKMDFRGVYWVAGVMSILLSERTVADTTDGDVSAGKNPPTVMIAVLVRNKAHTLPYFLTLLERFDYPKHRISLWIRSDHNEDNTPEILRDWVSSAEKEYDYHSVNLEILSSPPHRIGDETGPAHWTPQRFTHVIQLREEALETARQLWADYVWFMDSDVFITEPGALKELIAKDKVVVAPMLASDGMYSNFWGGMTEEYYYKRTEEYQPIYYREETGCFNVPMIHSSVLVDLRKALSNKLTFVPSKIENYSGPHDDIITFAVGANKSDVSLIVCNDVMYGFIMMPLDQNDQLTADYEQLVNLKVEILSEFDPLPLSESLAKYVQYPEPDTLGLDEIYVINLERRPERRLRMERSLQELGIAAKFVSAVDGRKLDDAVLLQMGITQMTEYADPYKKRPMTMGEIGCFMSHFNIWTEVSQYGLAAVLVLEDDIRFEPFFRRKLYSLMDELRELRQPWDLVYLGRKRLEKEEPWLPNAKQLVRPGYSYWTLGYMLSLSGARKLLAARPLDNLVPVDEYLPILFDRHPEESWKARFPRRDLLALSAAPLLLYPTHYTGDKGYVSDTENSEVIPEPLRRPRPAEDQHQRQQHRVAARNEL